MSEACPVCGAYQREVLAFLEQIAAIAMTHHGQANGLLPKGLRDQARGLLSVPTTMERVQRALGEGRPTRVPVSVVQPSAPCTVCWMGDCDCTCPTCTSARAKHAGETTIERVQRAMSEIDALSVVQPSAAPSVTRECWW